MIPALWVARGCKPTVWRDIRGRLRPIASAICIISLAGCSRQDSQFLVACEGIHRGFVDEILASTNGARLTLRVNEKSKRIYERLDDGSFELVCSGLCEMSVGPAKIEWSGRYIERPGEEKILTQTVGRLDRHSAELEILQTSEVRPKNSNPIKVTALKNLSCQRLKGEPLSRI